MKTNSVLRRYAWRPDRPDPRDFVYLPCVGLINIPRKADLSSSCSPVEDQGPLGSCTGNSSVGAVEYLEIKSGVKPFTDLSRLFPYYQARVTEGTVRKDAGAEIRDVVKGLAKFGVPSEKIWPYNVKRFATRPSQAAYEDAARRKITSYHRLVGLSAMLDCIADGYPVIFGFTVYESFESDEVARTGVLEMPKPHERELGGHAVLAVGFDQDTRQLKVRNSWGAKWGQDGYFLMPFGYIENASLSDDFWTIRKEATQ